MNTNILSGMPKIYYINLNRSVERNTYMINQFKKYNISNYERVTGEDILENESLDFLGSALPRGLKPVEAVVVFSHIKAIQQFLKTNDDWCIVCEDDVDFSTYEKWNFTWDDFFIRIPKTANIVQLVISTRPSRNINFHIHQRTFWDFNATAYLINRKQATDIVKKYFDKKLYLDRYKMLKTYDIDNTHTFLQERYSTIEEILYGINKDSVYSIPLFTYDIDLESISNPEHRYQTVLSHDIVVDYWNNKSKNFNIDDIMDL